MSPRKKESPEKSYLCHNWGKYDVKNTVFSLESAHQLLVSLQAKQADHSVKAKLHGYTSLFKLSTKGAFGSRYKKIPYLTIQRFFVFKSEPHLIFLGIQKKNRLSYAVILFRDIKEVNEVCDLIEQKRGGIIRETDNHSESEIVVCYENSVEKEVEVIKEQFRTEEEPMTDVVSNETQSDPVEEKSFHVNSYDSSPVIDPNVEPELEDEDAKETGPTSTDALLMRTNKGVVDSRQWVEDMKYIEYNPLKGTATETEFGPIYMYTAHFAPADYNNIGSCESDNDSWSEKSVDSRSSSDLQGIVVKRKDGRTVVLAHRGSDTGLNM